ncbi:MAG: glycosyltransferase family 4 protein, partial [Clostridia bacterium]
MKIWILNHYATNQFFENGGRHYDFAKYLKRAGHDPVVFCCNAKHNTRSELCFDMNGAWQEHQAEAIGVPFVFVKGRPYIGNGKQRILNMIDYFHNVQKATLDYAKLHGAPDVLIGSSVHPLACIAAIKLSKRLHCKNIVEIRDLWPESLAAYGLVGKKNPLLKAMLACEKWIYTKADVIIFTMAGGRDYIVEKGWDTSHGGFVDLAKVHHINNGVDLEAFESNKARYVWKDSDLDDPHTFKVIYTGSIRAVNNLSLLVDAAEYLRAANDHDIKLLIFGDGDQREALVTRCLQAGLHNICFKDKV